MFHMVTVCGMCDLEITGEAYDERHWSDDGYEEYHPWCCPDCSHDNTELQDAVSGWYDWDKVSQEIMNKEDK
jgi:hypothetical protein